MEKKTGKNGIFNEIGLTQLEEQTGRSKYKKDRE